MAKDTAPTPPIVNPSPKQRFMAEGRRISSHRSIMQTPGLRESIDYALLQYQHILSHTSTGEANTAAAAMFKTRGALEFIEVLYTLAEAAPEAPKAINISRLDHSA